MTTFTPVGQSLIDLVEWQNAAVRAIVAAGLDDTASEADLWDVLEAEGLNRGTPRPSPQVESKRPAPQPRTYKPASYWRAKRDAVEAKLAAFDDGTLPDRAAAWAPSTSASHRRAVSRQRAATDARLERYARLCRQRDALAGKLQRAEAREARAS